MVRGLKIPEATVIRLSVYSRYLSQVDRRGVITISSGEIAEGVGVSPAQVRKDLAYFGEFGTRGVGYNAKDLHRHVLKILGLNSTWSLAIVGAGNLGTALCMYGGFRERGFNVLAIFDNDPQKIGYKLNGIEIYPLSEMKKLVARQNISIGVITVPASAAQEVARLLAEAGVRAILNFAPTVINVADSLEVRNVDLAVNLELLTFNLVNPRSRDLF